MCFPLSCFKYLLDAWPWKGHHWKTQSQWIDGETITMKLYIPVPKQDSLSLSLWVSLSRSLCLSLWAQRCLLNPWWSFLCRFIEIAVCSDSVTWGSDRGGHTPYLLEWVLRCFHLLLPRGIFALLRERRFFHSGSDTRSQDSIPRAVGSESWKYQWCWRHIAHSPCGGNNTEGSPTADRMPIWRNQASKYCFAKWSVHSWAESSGNCLGWIRRGKPWSLVIPWLSPCPPPAKSTSSNWLPFGGRRLTQVLSQAQHNLS